ncbi:MAG: HlyC/CorC family transporter [Deltaproteobacteria bacterium]|nr:HlyC/CorC family transporter [Deltaproteobacteria bacterium]
MAIFVLVVVVTILVSALCGLLEATLFSTRRTTLEAESVGGPRKSLALHAIELKRRISVPIASILILNTVANTGGSSVAGMYAPEVLGPAGLPLFSIGLTLGILFFAEIMPKNLAAVHWRKLWPFIVWPLTALTYALYPAVFLAQKFSDLITRGQQVPTVTEAEILASVRLGASEGQITNRESRLVHNIINLEDRPIREIMTPRTVIFSLDAQMTVEEAVKAVDRRGFTRIPLYEGDRENIIGYMIIHDLFSGRLLANPQQPIKSIAKPISFVPQTTNSLALLTTALKQRAHIYIVVDEYGGVAGLITLEDLIETILGDEIVDETDRAVDLQELARQRRTQRPT